ncbi:MAG: ABC transporter permease [Oscillibacter sp.]|nr:ABC transporter permease [Oscillibacter sp.]
MAEQKTPLARLAKRDAMSPWQIWCIRLSSFLAALLLGALIFQLIGQNPLSAYGTILSGALGKATAVRQTVKIAVPLLGTALAIAPCFKMRFWNIGAEGQITAGAVAASYFALFWYDKLPSPLLLCVMGAAGILAGGVWAMIPALCKAKWDTNETLFTLMMNYIIIGVVRWLQGGPWEGRPGSQIIPQFNAAAVLPKVLGVHCGWIVVLILTVLMYVYMNYTKHGYEIAVIGESGNTARYAGMDVGRIMVRTLFLSGGVSGLVGFLVASGANTTLYDGVAAGVGFTAITVAWLAQLNPFAMVAISALLAVLDKGADTLQTRMAVPASISDIITGIFLFCMLGCEFFINYRLIFRGRENTADENPSGGTLSGGLSDRTLCGGTPDRKPSDGGRGKELSGGESAEKPSDAKPGERRKEAGA